jgi:hypothetical protein
MNTITLTTETETELTFTFTVDHAYMLTTPYGIDDPSDMLDIIFDNDTTQSVTLTVSAFNNPHNYYFATSAGSYGSDCTDYDHIDDIAYAFGRPIIDAVTAELNRRNWPLKTNTDYDYFAQNAADYFAQNAAE